MEDQGLIHGYKVARGASVITRLFFADDNYLSFKANMHECLQVKECLLNYEKVFGQKVNFEKSAITFNANVLNNTKEVCYYVYALGSSLWKVPRPSDHYWNRKKGNFWVYKGEDP